VVRLYDGADAAAPALSGAEPLSGKADVPDETMQFQASGPALLLTFQSDYDSEGSYTLKERFVLEHECGLTPPAIMSAEEREVLACVDEEGYDCKQRALDEQCFNGVTLSVIAWPSACPHRPFPATRSPPHWSARVI
jgi:hypothetical protein